MLKAENELVNQLIKTNETFKSLFEEHIALEQDLEALYSLKTFPPEVEARIKEIKVIKLRGKDKMQMLLAQHKSQNS